MAPDSSFRILVLGDFSGRSNRGLHAPLAGRNPFLVDRDNFDEVLEILHPSLQVASTEIRFNSLEDFHPDRLYQQLPAFRRLSEMRLQRPPATPSPQPAGREHTNILEDMLREAPDGVSVEDANDLAAFLKKVTAPHLEARPDPRQLDWRARIDAASAELMNGILHHPAFQSVEAAWRSLAMLVNRLDTDGPLKIHLFDTTLGELTQDVELLRTLFVQSNRPWSAMVGNFSFGQTGEDAAHLRRIAQTALVGGAPFIAEALPPSGDPEEQWLQFRHSAESIWVGLAVPRFLLRLPYGAQTSPVDAFPFEEMPRHEHSSYLWGNPAFCCAYLPGEAFLSHGWQMRPGDFRDVQNLPLHTYQEDGLTVAKPCAEVLLSERDADFLLDSGFMPLASVKGADSVLLVRFQSVAQPLAVLAGRWASPRAASRP